MYVRGMGRGEGRPMDDFIPSEDLSGVEQLTRSAVIATQNVARLRRQLEKVELVEKGNLKGQIVERAVKLLALLNDLMANYQMLRRRISPLAE